MCSYFSVVVTSLAVFVVADSSSSSTVENANSKANGYCRNTLSTNNNIILYCEEQEYRYHHAADELKGNATSEEVEVEESEADNNILHRNEQGYKFHHAVKELKRKATAKEIEESEVEAVYEDKENDEDDEDDEDLGEEWEQDDDEEDEEWELQEEEKVEYTPEELEIMEKLYETYRSIIFEQIGDEEYELESMEVVYGRYLEWKNPQEEEIHLDGREQDIHDALQRYRLEPSSTPSPSAEDDVKLHVEDIAFSYTDLPTRMIIVIKPSDTPLSSLLNSNNINDNDEQQQQQENLDLYIKIVRISVYVYLFLVMCVITMYK
ncbi:hypothetical protein FRACYDRAFT_245094 [Fragilariopsis cylindrus CCMP1102]|uniref:Uncharacterized protein n=1 Tax=Fragilariopsis cylindrus CCMP1102 TaxID=635003 RepID=A0A1E7F1B2_9STRA|nr:hypothetical protein FRACYDRAFT_245094 [Fragilariopsis cylindrus CCMP1102]|eukprot:OEU11970.1 hypothetical protein FRACYDRAFT_245094 [Fragilariopsis cylindrus CCMP1102]